MPADFGDITAYHQEEAARHYALAQAARERGCFADAEYQAGLAARWDEAAQEQKIGKMQAPSRRMAKQRPHCPASPPPTSLAFSCLLAVERCVKRIAVAIRQSIIKRSAHFDGLSLR
ncbi:MAG: hypothetical protein ABR990_08325 [Terracidiphilus sp.]|jgi:hypothetical protein